MTEPTRKTQEAVDKVLRRQGGSMRFGVVLGNAGESVDSARLSGAATEWMLPP